MTVNQSIDQPPNQSASQVINQSTDQPIKKRGGKSNDPNYMRLTGYIRRSTVEELERRKLEFSAVIQQALDDWLKTH